MENIPVFGRVAQKETAYNTAVSEYNAANKALGEAQTKYDEAVTAKENADGEVTKAETAAAPLQKAYDDALETKEQAQNAFDNFKGEKYKKELTGYNYAGNATRYKEYTVFYNAANANKITATSPEMFCGFYSVQQRGKATDRIVFVIGTQMQDAVTAQLNAEDIDIEWYPDPITPSSICWGNGNNPLPSYDQGLDKFLVKDSETGTEYSPQHGRLYYYDYYTEDEGQGDFHSKGDVLRYGETTKLSSVSGIVDAFLVIYEHSDMKRTHPTTPIYTETEEESEEYKLVREALEEAEATLKTAEENLKEPAAALKAAEDALEEAKTALNTATTGLSTAETAKKDALSTLKNAVSELNDVATDIAVKDGEGELQYETVLEYVDENEETQKIEVLKYEEPYTTINVTNSFEVTASDFTGFTEWPANYTFNGNGYSIKSTKALFEINSGTIRNLANENGPIATDNENGKVYYCVVRRGGVYRAYHTKSDYDVYENMSIEDVIYKLDGFPFGYDVELGKILPLTEATTLYAAQYANANIAEPISFKLNISNDELKYSTSFQTSVTSTDNREVCENAIIYIEDNNAATIAAAEKIPNVAVKDAVGTSYTCYNMVLKDDKEAREFYIPGYNDKNKDYSFKSKKVSYEREFNQKYAAVCFPFTLTNTIQEKLGIEAAYQFSEVNPETKVMWFSLWKDVPANQPCLIVFKDEKFEENNIPGDIFAEYNGNERFVFKETPDELVAADGQNKNMFYGTYKWNTAAGFLNGNTTDAIYGIQKGELVKTKETATFKAFRSYVRTVNISTTAGAPSYKIGLMDEDGNELSTAIETVNGEIVSGFKAKGSDNAIEIITDKACLVKVYALNGALVKSTRVEAGVTSLPVKAGMYVVNGAKVIVK